MAADHMQEEVDRIALRQRAKFLDLLDLARPEIIGGNPLGFLKRELQLHRLCRRFLEIDHNLFRRQIP